MDINLSGNCDHYLDHLKCEAFLMGIPDEILEGRNDHSRPLPDQDNDLIFTSQKPYIMAAEKNANLNEHEQTIVDLTLGRREPKTESERRLQQQIDEIGKAGRIVEIPAEW